MTSSLRLNMTGAESDPMLRAKRYQAAIAMADFADKNGFAYINVEEHHCAQNGWLPSPLTMAAAIAARTEKAGIGIMALLVSLYDPVRLAEDIAVVDLLSNGRLSFIAGLGYREIEFHALDKPFATRGEWMDHVLDTLLKAWGDEPFEYRGEMINVTPKPFTRPHPMFLVGGMSKVAARRAARFGLPFSPPAYDAGLEAYYYEQLKVHGKKSFMVAPPADFSLLFVDEDPERAWAEIGHHFLNEVQEYNSWKRAGLARPMEMPSASVEEIRASGRYEILAPDELRQRRKNNPERNQVLHPLVGGMPLERAWKCLELYCETG
ncbi:MAG TPA: LLM class flavin-dependent oxidoreductase [Spongiibacteraceae bacterium]|nr:LLM class flavin-dependent oxidoreductase [Spongiibacteraceae bacterium]HCS26110.1 LLM class flavin-dependent oxidoreductase [Spongiibacteraceae bacterium]